MSQQEQVNQIVQDFCALITQRKLPGVSRVHLQETDGYVVGRIEEQTGGAAIELWSEQEKLTLVYSQNHWHIEPDSATEPMKQVVREMEQDCGAIIEGKLLTCSAWQGERPLGGCTVDGTEEEAIQQATAWFPDATTIYIKQWGNALITHDLTKEAR